MNDEDYDLALRAELEPNEHVIWRSKPNIEAIRGSLLIFTTAWLCGLFMMGAGLLRNTTDDAHVLTGMTVLLVLVAVSGIVEMIFVPRRASRTIYVLTDARILSLSISRRLFTSNVTSYRDKEIHRTTKNSVTFFYLTNLPAQLMFCILTYDVLRSLFLCFDPFIAIGFIITLFSWLQPTLQDMRLPLPKFRDAQRTFYSVGDIFVFLESFRLSEIAEFTYRKARENTFNAFVISKSSGCIRMRAIPEVKSIEAALAEVPKL